LDVAQDTNQNGESASNRLNSDREEVARALLASNHGDPNHGALEAKFNDIEKQLFLQSGGKTEDYAYKHDVRHCFAFKEEANPADGTKTVQVATMATQADGTPYVLLPPKEVINWRNTKAGAKADDDNRKAKSRDSLDDAGHLIALEYGSSPSEPRNIADQGFIQNEWGTWRQQEKQLAEFVNSHDHCRVRVEVNYFKNKYGERSLYWRMKAVDGNNVPLTPVVIHVNFKANYANRPEGAQHMREIQEALAERDKNGFIKREFTIV
jgi:DNA/RNA non-specific endonuclease